MTDALPGSLADVDPEPLADGLREVMERLEKEATQVLAVAAPWSLATCDERRAWNVRARALLMSIRDLRAALAAEQPPAETAGRGERPSNEVLDLLEDVWAQFAIEVEGHRGWRFAHLSTLEDVEDVLTHAGRLRRVRPDKDWCEPVQDLPAPSPAETTANPTCRTCHYWREQEGGMGTCMATVTPAYETDSCEGHEPSPAPGGDGGGRP